MNPTNRWVPLAERALLTILFAWLMWLPLPFGSVVERARLPLAGVPLALAVIASLIRLHATRDRSNTAQPTGPWLFWGNGALLLLAAGALQLIPLPRPLLAVVSPESHAIWSGATQLAASAGAKVRSWWPVTVDPRATTFELVRMTAIFATFTTSALMIRSHTRRRVLAGVLCIAAIFQAVYGLREAALQRYEIWGWVNKLIFDRVTGTFVNPNHFAHYIVIILPMAIFLAASAWRDSGARQMPVFRHLAAMIERHALMIGFTLLTAIACLAAILLSQSRAAVLALASSFLGVSALLPGKRMARVILGATSALALIVALVIFLGPERTIARFSPAAVEKNAEGRRYAMAAATRVWQRFPVFGSGYGTFAAVVSMEQDHETDRSYHHAHNDYLELAATGGAIGFLIGVIALAGGYAMLVRMTFGEQSRELSWVRRAYQTAVLLSVGAAMIHALFDFNFFIPANPSTLAAIAGAAVASIDHDRRTRR